MSAGALEDLIAAIKENTAAHLELAKVAVAAQSGKTTAAAAEKPKDAGKEEPEEKSEEEEDEDEAAKKAAAAKKRKAAAAKKKKEAEEAAKAEAGNDGEDEGDLPDVTESATAEECLKVASAFMATDDDETRDDHKAKLTAALAHLGAKKLGGLSSDEDRGKLVTYIAYWNADLKVDFRAVDERIAESDDPLG